MKNKIKYLISLILITILFLPRPASADIFGVMDLFESQLSAEEEFTSVPMNTWVKTFLLYVIGLAAFYTSASLFSWVINVPMDNPALISLNNEFVMKGWTLVSGLVNMILILFFLAIAFAYIFKIETFTTKKVLPKLIIAALLVNFSLVFVKALLDISTILYNYILQIAGRDIVSAAFGAFFNGIMSVIIMMAGSILALMAPLMIPPAAPFAQLGVLVLWLTAGIFFIPVWLLQLGIAFLFSFIFFLLFFLFSVRIFIIWILAVFSPLAFVCWALPQAEQYWKDWLKYLIEWMFLGIIVLFLLALGLKTIPSVDFPPLTWVGILPVPAWFFYYAFLAIYLLIVIWWMTTKAMPTFASFLITQATELGKIIWGKGIKPMGGIAVKGAEELAVREKEAEERAKAEKRPLTRGEKVLKGITTPVRWGYRVAGVTPEFVAAKRVERESKKFEDAYGKDIDTALATHLGIPIVTPEMKAALGLYLAKMKGAKGIEKLSPDLEERLKQEREIVQAIERTAPKKLEDFIKHTPELIDDEKVGELIRRTIVSKGLEMDEKGKYKDEDIQRMINTGIKIDGEDIEELVKTDMGRIKVIRKAAFKKAVDAMKVADIENLAVSTLKNENFQEMAVRFKDVNFTRRIGEEKGDEYARMIHDKAEELGPEEIAKTNATLLRSAITNPGFRAIFPPIKGAERVEEVDSLIKLVMVRKPVLLEYDKARRKAKELREKGRPDAVLEKEVKEAKEKIEATPELKEALKEIEKLRKPRRREEAEEERIRREAHEGIRKRPPTGTV